MKNMLQQFNFIGTIGKGGFCTVYLAQDIMTQKYYAIKEIYITKLNPKELNLFETEKKVLRTVQHKNIIKLYNVIKYIDIGRVLIVLEYCNGGSLHTCLYNYIKKYGKPFPEKIVKYLMKKILEGVKCLHDHGIIHRDLKLGNILLKYYNQKDLDNQNILASEVKIIDFNTSYFPNESQPITILGTIPNMAPSIINNAIFFGMVGQKAYDEKVDIWSLGTLCYEMLFGKPLFGNKEDIQMIGNIYYCNFTIPNTISYPARSFLYAMLQKRGEKRLSSAQLLNHEFIRNYNNFSHYNQNSNNINIAVNNIANNGKVNILFKNLDKGKFNTIITESNITIKNLIKLYLIKINKPELINNLHLIGFLYNGSDLKKKLYSTVGDVILDLTTILVYMK